MLMSAEVQGFFVHWVEAYIVLVHLPGTTTIVTPGTNEPPTDGKTTKKYGWEKIP